MRLQIPKYREIIIKLDYEMNKKICRLANYLNLKIYLVIKLLAGLHDTKKTCETCDAKTLFHITMMIWLMILDTSYNTANIVNGIHEPSTNKLLCVDHIFNSREISINQPVPPPGEGKKTMNPFTR